MVSGWFGQLGNGVRASKLLWSVHQDHSSSGLDKPNHELRNTHLYFLLIRSTLIMALIPDLAHLPLKEREFLYGMLSASGCSFEQGEKKTQKLALGTAKESRHSHVQEELNFP